MNIILNNTPLFDDQKMYYSVMNDNLETIGNQETRHFFRIIKMMHLLQVKDFDDMSALNYY